MSSPCANTTTNGPGAAAASDATTSAQLDPQAPPMVAPCPAVRLSNTAAKPGWSASSGTSCGKRSDSLGSGRTSELIAPDSSDPGRRCERNCARGRVGRGHPLGKHDCFTAAAQRVAEIRCALRG